MRIRLFTAKKEAVAEYDVPDFNEYPQTIVWGIRLFIREEEYTGKGEKFEYVYLESTFNYCIVDGAPMTVKIS
jgi:hypothetical protein